MTRVLVVDDEQGIRRTFDAFLRGAGYAVETAENGVVSMHVFDVMGHKTFQDNIQTQNAPFYPILILTPVVIALSLLNLLLYKHRLKQIRLCQLIMLLIVVLVVLIFQQSETRATDVTHVVYHIGTYITVVAIVWVFLASQTARPAAVVACQGRGLGVWWCQWKALGRWWPGWWRRGWCCGAWDLLGWDRSGSCTVDRKNSPFVAV